MSRVKLLRASAGSGKTWRLAYEYVRAVVEEPSQYAHILAVTFTNKATAEMKRRIVEQINLLSRGEKSDYSARLRQELELTDYDIQRRATSALRRILHDYSRFSVLTIDKFFQRIIRSFIRELGLDIKVTLQLQTGGLLSSAADNIVDELSMNAALRDWVLGFVEEKIEENRRWEIKNELVALGREIFREDYHRRVANSASKEELKYIVERISATADRIISEAQKQAKQSLQLIEANGLTVSDFSGRKTSFANYFKKVADGSLPEPGNTVLKALESDDVWAAKSSPQREVILSLAPRLRLDLQQLTDTWTKHHRMLNSVEILRRNYRNFALLTDLAEKMAAICTAENILPIAETNNIIGRLVAGNDAPFLYEKVGNHFSRLMIDEFQDTSAMQWENFLPLIHNALAQSEDAPVLLVGDVKQSIYRWRGGDWRILSNRIERLFSRVEIENLDTNYRSLENIVDFNNLIIECIVASDNAKLDAELSEAQSVGLIDEKLKKELTGLLHNAYERHRQHSARGAGGYVTITEREDLSPVIARVEDLLSRGFSAGDIAILVRTGAEGREIAAALLEHGFQVVTQEALLLNSAPVTAFVSACYRLAGDMNDDLRRAIFNRWLGRLPDAQLSDEECAWFKKLGTLAPEGVFENIVERYSLGARENDVAYLQAFEDQVFAFSRGSIGDVKLFSKWWDENSANVSVEIPDAGTAITVSTIHKAKGLQYRAVIVPWCSWSMVPIPRSTIWVDAGEIEKGLGELPVGFVAKMKDSFLAAEYYRESIMSHVDAINIFYVAATRAEEELHIMMPASARNKDRIDALILDAAGEMREFGEPLSAVAGHKKEDSMRIKVDFETFSIGHRLRLRRPSVRYEGARGFGVAMHRVFENAADLDDVTQSVEAMKMDGVLSENEVSQLLNYISRAFENPLIRSWFGEKWDVVQRENDILTTEGNLRPDRVMLRGKEAVIVDYKFGLSRTQGHKKQISDYAATLRRMGFNNVKGYIWYVSLGDVEAVS